MPSGNPNATIKPGPGRALGSKNKATLFIQRACRGILETDEYRQSVIRRIKRDTLAPAVETMFHHYAYGKPKDVVEVIKRDNESTEGMTADQLADEAQRTALEIIELKSQAEAQRREEQEQLAREQLIADEQERLAAEYRAQAVEREREAQKLADELDHNGTSFFAPPDSSTDDDHVT